MGLGSNDSQSDANKHVVKFAQKLLPKVLLEITILKTCFDYIASFAGKITEKKKTA